MFTILCIFYVYSMYMCILCIFSMYGLDNIDSEVNIIVMLNQPLVLSGYIQPLYHNNK